MHGHLRGQRRLALVLLDKLLQLGRGVHGLHRLHRRVHVVLHVPQPRRLIDRHLHGRIVEALRPLLLHLLEGAQEAAHVPAVEVRAGVQAVDGLVVVPLDVRRLSGQQYGSLRQPLPFRRPKGRHFHAVLGALLGVHASLGVPRGEVLVRAVGLLPVACQLLPVCEHQLGDLRVLPHHGLDGEHHLLLNLVGKLRRLLDAGAEVAG
mmetsp:Transcript_75099/g.232241  ORF Transcript_75099/g.232241 Transcript_75099/m.232241 type:complete len:206 (+) Transcript_75099:356-973(+)